MPEILSGKVKETSLNSTSLLPVCCLVTENVSIIMSPICCSDKLMGITLFSSLLWHQLPCDHSTVEPFTEDGNLLVHIQCPLISLKRVYKLPPSYQRLPVTDLNYFVFGYDGTSNSHSFPSFVIVFPSKTIVFLQSWTFPSCMVFTRIMSSYVHILYLSYLHFI